MPEPFKNLINAALVRECGAHLKRVWPGFDRRAFEARALAGTRLFQGQHPRASLALERITRGGRGGEHRGVVAAVGGLEAQDAAVLDTAPAHRDDCEEDPDTEQDGQQARHRFRHCSTP